MESCSTENKNVPKRTRQKFDVLFWEPKHHRLTAWGLSVLITVLTLFNEYIDVEALVKHILSSNLNKMALKDHQKMH